MIAYFYNKTTQAPGVGLTPTVSILNASTNTVVVNNQPMTALALDGWYIYNYTINTEMDYAVNYNPNDTNFFYSVDKMKEKQSTSGGGWSGGSYTANFSGNFKSINNQILDILKELKKIQDQIDSIEKTDLSPILEKIDSIELNEKETDLSPIQKSIEDMKKSIKSIPNIDKIMPTLSDISKCVKSLEEMEKSDKEKEKTDAEKEKQDIIDDANEIIQIYEEEKAKHTQNIEELKNKIITSLSE